MNEQYLIRSIPPRLLWEFIHENEPVSRLIFAGFQDRPESLKQAIVLERLDRLTETDEEFRQALPEVWRLAHQELVTSVALSTPKELRLALQDMAQHFGREALGCALEFDSRKTVRALAKRLQQLEGIPEIEPPEPEPQAAVPESPAVVAEKREKQEAEKRERIRELNKEVEQLRGELARAEKAKDKADQELAQLREKQHKTEEKLHSAQRQAERFQKSLADASAALKSLERQQRRAVTGAGPAGALADAEQAVLAAIAARDWQVAQRGCAELLESAAGIQQLVGRLLRALAAAQSAKAPEPLPLPAQPMLVWSSNGVRCQRTPQQAVAAIKTNDEELIGQLRVAIKTISAKDRERWRQWLREVDNRVDWFALLSSTGEGPAIVDGSNVAHHRAGEGGRAKLANLMGARRALYGMGYFPLLLYVDAALVHQIDDPLKLRELCDRGELEMVPAGLCGDEWIVAEARKRECPVITNDRMEEWDPGCEIPKLRFELSGDHLTLRD